MPLGSFVSAGRSLDRAIERAQTAERLGYDSVYTTHIAGRDSMAVLEAYASRTERVKLGTGVLPIYSRTPAATAQIAATIDEFWAGREETAAEVLLGVMAGVDPHAYLDPGDLAALKARAL